MVHAEVLLQATGSCIVQLTPQVQGPFLVLVAGAEEGLNEISKGPFFFPFLHAVMFRLECCILHILVLPKLVMLLFAWNIFFFLRMASSMVF